MKVYELANELAQQKKDYLALTKTASTGYLMQLFEKTEASGTIQDFIDTFKDAKVTMGEVNAMMFFNLKKEDARTLLITFNVFMAHITAPIYTTTLRPKPTKEREAYNREREHRCCHPGCIL